jgi:serine protease AprX
VRNFPIPSISAFIVLLERRATPLRLAGALAAAVVSFAMLFGAATARAQPSLDAGEKKLSHELRDIVKTGATPAARWVHDVAGVRHLQAVVVTDGVDPLMTGVRAQVLRAGGSIHAMHPAVHAVTVQLPADELHALAQRSDVVSVSPNRDIRRTASMLEMITGTLTSNVRSHSSPSTYSGLDGSGIGIAILDSGVMKSHEAFENSSDVSRVQRNVNMLNASLANWTTGVDSTTSLAPGSSALAAYEAAIAADSAGNDDAYGHGTLVASVAAGRYYTATAAGPQDISGVAPNANLYDVKVLDSQGNGTMSDALEGIEWVIYHARDYNIKVMNVSLAADSTESWQSDPLCAAVRSAAAAGITVVVAAGNFGQSTQNQEVYGAISSPGNDPSVITVGAVNFHNTVGRGDDTVANFSSRGPTRSSYVDTNGATVYDNLLKPDLVAPGNRIVGAAATADSTVAWNLLANNYFSSLVTPLSFSSYTPGETQMILSGTSVAAPAVTGTVALMLQANRGLTPPLVKAILQYTAQPLPGYNLLEQGAGYLNVDGAVVLAKALRNDIAWGGYNPGESILASGQTMPAASSTINGASFN